MSLGGCLGLMVVGSGWLSVGKCLSLDGCRLMSLDDRYTMGRDGFGYSSLSRRCQNGGFGALYTDSNTVIE